MLNIMTKSENYTVVGYNIMSKMYVDFIVVELKLNS